MHGEGRERRKVRKKVNKAQEKVNHGQKHSREGVTAGHHRTVRHHRTPPTAQRTPTDTTTAAGTTDSTAAAQGERGRRAHHPGASERAQTGECSAVQCSAVQCMHPSVRPSVGRWCGGKGKGHAREQKVSKS